MKMKTFNEKRNTESRKKKKKILKSAKRYLFRAFEEITSNHKKGTFFALLRRLLVTAKKVPFSRF